MVREKCYNDFAIKIAERIVMEALVFETINKLKEIKKRRLEERGLLSSLTDDEVIIHIDNLIETLTHEYLVQ